MKGLKIQVYAYAIGMVFIGSCLCSAYDSGKFLLSAEEMKEKFGTMFFFFFFEK